MIVYYYVKTSMMETIIKDLCEEKYNVLWILTNVVNNIMFVLMYLIVRTLYQIGIRKILSINKIVFYIYIVFDPLLIEFFRWIFI